MWSMIGGMLPEMQVLARKGGVESVHRVCKLVNIVKQLPQPVSGSAAHRNGGSLRWSQYRTLHIAKEGVVPA